MKALFLIFGFIGIICGFLLLLLSDNDAGRAFMGLFIAFASAIVMVLRLVFGK